MRFLRLCMDEEVIIRESPENLDHQALLDSLNLEGCGAVVSF